MRDLTCTGFRAALFVTGAWMFITLWSGSAAAGQHGLMTGATTAGLLAVPVLVGWSLAWVLRRRAEAGPPAPALQRPSRRPGRRLTRHLAGTARGVSRPLALMVGLMAALLVASQAAMVNLARVGDLVPRAADGPVPAAMIDGLADAQRLAMLVEIGLFIAFALTFLIAAGLLRNELESRGGHGFRWSWRWTAVTLFIPLLNLVRPWLGLSEIDRAVTTCVQRGEVGDGWRRAGRLSLPTLLVGMAWVARFAAEGTTAQAGAPLLIGPVDGAAWHAAVAAMVDTSALRLAVDLIVMVIMVWWVWRLHGLIRRI